MRITIRETDGIGGGIGGGACGVGRAPTPGWPEVYFYILEEHGNGGTPVVELDGDEINARHIKENSGWGSCYGVEPLDAVTRHRLIAYWLGISSNDMVWHPAQSFTIVWTSKAAYTRQLGEIIDSQRHKLRDTAEQLRDRGFLTEDEAKRVTPRLVVHLECAITPCPL